MTRTEFEDMVEHDSAYDMEATMQCMFEYGYFDSSYNYDVVSGEDYADWLSDEINNRNYSSVSDIETLMKWLEDQPYPDETCYYYRGESDNDYSEVHNGDYEKIINDLRNWMDDRFDDEDDDYDDDYDSYGDDDDDEEDCEVATVGMSYQTVLEQRADKQKTIFSQIDSLFQEAK